MARLILSLDSQVLAEYNMSKERYTIGRLPDNDVRIDNPAVSGHHSLIINILNDSFLEDLNSTNGTYVNGKLIKKHALQNGDVITIGHHQLRFSDEPTNDTEQDEFEKRWLFRQASKTPSSSPKPRRLRTRPSRLVVEDERVDVKVDMPELDKPREDDGLAGSRDGRGRAPGRAGRAGGAEVAAPEDPARPLGDDDRRGSGSGTAGATAGEAAGFERRVRGRELELTKALTTLGRPGVQVAAITRRKEGYFVVHVESGEEGDFPLVNGQPIGAQARKLSDNDVVQIAGVKMGFFAS